LETSVGHSYHGIWIESIRSTAPFFRQASTATGITGLHELPAVTKEHRSEAGEPGARRYGRSPSSRQNGATGKYTYTKYDFLSRPTEEPAPINVEGTSMAM
jgi:hypothetical protein